MSSKPASPRPQFLVVGKRWLHLTAGLMWLCVGVMLNVFAARWLKVLSLPVVLRDVGSGTVLAGPIYFFGFARLARKNIARIAMLPGERASLFAFQSWASYPMVAFMIMLGIYLRAYSPVPKPLLAIMYMGIGGGLFLAGLHYIAELRRQRRLVVEGSSE